MLKIFISLHFIVIYVDCLLELQKNVPFDGFQSFRYGIWHYDIICLSFCFKIVHIRFTVIYIDYPLLTI